MGFQPLKPPAFSAAPLDPEKSSWTTR